MEYKLLKKQADTIRFLSADMVQKANSGHPGAPMGLADIVTVLSYHLKHNPVNPKWLNRDRLVFSGGHASALVYSFLHLSGYDIGIEDLKNFRQLGSKTPGHPEYGEVAGVEVTTGPLGQGVANAVGFAAAAKYASNILNTDGVKVIDHKVYCLCGDGDLEEGISYEACSFAGHLGLDNLVLIYDSNNITIEGSASLAFSEDIKSRFEAQGWEVSKIDGHNFDEINEVLSKAKEQTKPYLIIADTIIAKGACELEGSHNAHGAPLGSEVIKNAKIKAGFDENSFFFVPDDVKEEFVKAKIDGERAEKEWKQKPLTAEQKEILDKLLNPNFDSVKWPLFEAGSGVATRDSNGKIINEIAKALLGFLGGSADLAPSNKSELNGMGSFPKGRNIHFGIREHAMAAICNAISLYGLFLPYSATFFIFSDYLKPSARLAALMRLKTFFIWTHDSIGVGEDGPTHQPIEQLTQFRAQPNFYVWRPADANENVEAWKKALRLNAPSAFVLSRQKLTVLDGKKDFGSAAQGGYLLKKAQNPKITLISSGSEVELCVKAACRLKDEGIDANVVSVPCFDLFTEQSKEYIQTVIDKNTKVLAVEASSGDVWWRYADDIICMKSFGSSAPSEKLFEKFGFSVENVVKRAKELLASAHGV
ncbi:MAG: transketolase [Campylobacteraceae bacterium]|nr:transketolase [Campylobacteraceae bacterium]